MMGDEVPTADDGLEAVCCSHDVSAMQQSVEDEPTLYNEESASDCGWVAIEQARPHR
jgi:hypothetical protein